MKTNYNFTSIILTCFLSSAIFFSCTKNSGSIHNKIQQGDSVIEIFLLYPISPVFLIKYNNVIEASIRGTVTFHLKNGDKHDIPFSIPAGYKQLESWGGDNYLNVWDYTSYYDSTSGGTPSAGIDGSWDVDFVDITSVSCPDKSYGFKVLKASDNWDYYHPSDPITLVNFVSNGDTVSYTGYAFEASSSLYSINSSIYGFYFFSFHFQMISAPSVYPLQSGLTMEIPFLRYYWNSRNYGSEVNASDTASNGSTLKLTITSVNDRYFDAGFSGKIWSSLNPDTLFISDGVIKNALLPVRSE